MTELATLSEELQEFKATLAWYKPRPVGDPSQNRLDSLRGIGGTDPDGWLVTAGEIAAHLHVSTRTVQRLIREDGFPIEHLRQQVITHKSWIRIWIEAGKGNTGKRRRSLNLGDI